MNLKTFHTEDKPVQAVKIFPAAEGLVNALQITAGNKLKEHITQVPAFLICVIGEVVFENEKGASEKLLAGDYVLIEPMVKHWVMATQDSNLLLIK